MQDPNVEVLRIVAHKLGNIANELVFIGGSVIGLYIKDQNVTEIRPTKDVDCVVEVTSRAEYEALSKKLRAKGFNEDMESKVMCRFRNGSLILDVMPTEKKILGYTNRWYEPGIKNSLISDLGGIKIRVFSLPYLMASKVDAFKGRGQGEFRISHDMEDLVTLFDGIGDMSEQLTAAPLDVKKYLLGKFNSWLKTSEFLESIGGHISDRLNIEGRKKIVLARITSFVQRQEPAP